MDGEAGLGDARFGPVELRQGLDLEAFLAQALHQGQGEPLQRQHPRRELQHPHACGESSPWR